MADISQIKLPNNSTYNVKDIDGRKEENLVWGGPSQTGDVSPVGMALSCEHSSNRLAFINGNALTFEYSSDGGSTWTDYGYSATNKSAFCTQEYAVPVGRPNSSTEYTTSSRTRITLTAQNGTTGYVYTKPRKILINVSTSGGMQVLVEVRTGTNYQSSGAWSTLGTYTVSGWSGWNDIPLVISTLGGGKTQTGNYWQLRLTFIMTSIHATNKTNANVLSLRLFGSTAWTTPTGQLSKNGHIYSFDMSQNATFPANVTATKFIGALQGNANTSTNASKVNNHTVETDVPSGAVFTDTYRSIYSENTEVLSETDTLPIGFTSIRGIDISHGGVVQDDETIRKTVIFSADATTIPMSSTDNTSISEALSNKANKSVVNEYIISSSQYATIWGVGSYAILLVMGFAQGIGPVALCVQINNNVLTTYALLNGQAWSSSYLSFVYNSTNKYVNIYSTVSAQSRFTVIRCGLTT